MTAEGEQDGKFKPSEDERALKFAEQYADKARFDHDLGRWFIWNGQIWEPNTDGLALDWARGLCRVVGMRKWSAAGAVEKAARVDRRIAVSSRLWDQDPMLLGTPEGTVDLRDGMLRQADQGDYITRCTAVVPGSDTPVRWLKFLDEAMQGDAEMIRYLQVAAGYCLTGLTVEEILFFNHGSGGNGKSVFAELLMWLMGDYATAAGIETFMASTSSQHPTSVAALRGARFVVASETERGRHWNEQLVKKITGGDRMKARFMRQDEFEFTPQLKLWVLANNKPALKNVDDAWKRRFNNVPWLFKPEFKNERLKDELREEGPAILRWMIDGCLDWQAEGLPKPDRVAAETRRYFEEQDSLQQWLDECCDVDPEHAPDGFQLRCLSSKLYGSWSDWCKRAGEEAGSNKSFSADLSARGFRKDRGAMGVEFFRLRVRAGGNPAGA